MALFGRQQRGPTVRGRAVVVPASTGNVGGELDDGNFNNFTAGSRARSATRLIAQSAEDGRPVASDPQRVTCSLPNWMRLVLHDAGSGYGQAAHLPPELSVPVHIDQATRRIVSLDVDAAEAELQPYRALGRREWKETEAVLAPVRQAVKLPGTVARELPGVVRDWRTSLSELKSDLRGTPARNEPLTPQELEQRRQMALSARQQLQSNPKQRDKLRRQVLQHGPGIAATVVAGTYPAHEFSAWLMTQEVSGLITEQEAASLRDAAGLS
ncbi:MAG: hypothetical protein JHD16_14230 [Solirubrobacteraceae bacterium]|nr:hypothetical protein [Solirubrobacteraceae bacterium]